jgi:hypothetical protein
LIRSPQVPLPVSNVGQVAKYWPVMYGVVRSAGIVRLRVFHLRQPFEPEDFMEQLVSMKRPEIFEEEEIEEMRYRTSGKAFQY